MATILLARHGQSDWNAEGRWQGHADRPLTDQGRRQAGSLRAQIAEISLSAAYASDLRRAWETAEIAVRHRPLRVSRLAELREVDVGSWTGLTRADVAAQFPRAFERWTNGGAGWDDGESYEAMSARVISALGWIASLWPDGSVLVVTHGGPIRAIRAHALGLSMSEHRLTAPVEENARLSLVSVENGSMTLLD